MFSDGVTEEELLTKFEELGHCVEVVQSECGEVEIDDDYDFDDDYDECGFDPYAGCYTYDC